MFFMLFVPLLIVLFVVYFFASLFANTFGILPRLILAIVFILLISFVIKNFFAVVGVLLLIGLAFWIRATFIQPPKQPHHNSHDQTFDGDFEEVDKDKH